MATSNRGESFYGVAAAINKSVLGMGSYEMLYKEAPYLAFFSEKEKSKKSLLPKADFLNLSELGDMAEIITNVSTHYTQFVGLAYGACSVAAIWLNSHRHASSIHGIDLTTDPDFAAGKQALAYLYRVLYEDYGLSGYSPEAAFIFNGIQRGRSGKMGMAYPTTTDPDTGLPVRCGDELEICSLDFDRVRNEEDDYHLVETVDFLKAELDLPNVLVAAKILEFFQTASTYKWLELGNYEKVQQENSTIPKWRLATIKYAVIAGCLRRLGQGVDITPDEEEYDEKYSLWKYLEQFRLLEDKELMSPIIHEALSNGLEAWKAVRAFRVNLAAEADNQAVLD